MQSIKWAALTGLALAVLPLAARADWGYASKDLNLRAGPAREYPVVARVLRGVALDVQGCLDDYRWCDVVVGPHRGWVYAGNIVYNYQGARVPVLNYGAALGIVVLPFVLGAYWDDHYRGRPWYGQRDRWEGHRLPPPPPPRPGDAPGHRPLPPPPGPGVAPGHRPLPPPPGLGHRPPGPPPGPGFRPVDPHPPAGAGPSPRPPQGAGPAPRPPAPGAGPGDRRPPRDLPPGWDSGGQRPPAGGGAPAGPRPGGGGDGPRPGGGRPGGGDGHAPGGGRG